ATDARGVTAETTYLVTIEPAGALTVMPPVLANASLNVPYSEKFFVVGAQPPCMWQARGELPPGLNLVSAQGDASVENELRGTPMSPGTFTFTVTVTDSSNPPRTGSATHTLSVP
ncbi:MAG: putative Ig domain-containing protein, partial [Planctomycetota bacterium]